MGLKESLRDAFIATPHGEREKTALERRIGKLPDYELLTWVDVSAAELGKSVGNYQRDHAIEHLLEAEQSAEALRAMVQELRRRHE